MFECVFLELFGAICLKCSTLMSLTSNLLPHLRLKWLCNKKFLHFNLVSSAILWELWINRNNIVFNKVIWIIIKIRVGALIHAGMESVAQRSKRGQSRLFMDLILSKLKKSRDQEPKVWELRLGSWHLAIIFIFARCSNSWSHHHMDRLVFTRMHLRYSSDARHHDSP
jgi:hypothetical protein